MGCDMTVNSQNLGQFHQYYASSKILIARRSRFFFAVHGSSNKYNEK